MTLSNLEYFKDEILKNFVFPYIETASQSEDELVQSSLSRVELIFVTFVQSAVERYCVIFNIGLILNTIINACAI